MSRCQRRIAAGTALEAEGKMEIQTAVATELTENQLRELADSQAALARVAAEEKAEKKVEKKIAPVSTRSPASRIDPVAVRDWNLCDCRTDAKFAALLGKPRECPYAIDPERKAWLKEYDRARGFAEASPPEEAAFGSGWVYGFNYPNKVDFAVPRGATGKAWMRGWERGVSSRTKLDGEDTCLHNPGKFPAPVATQAKPLAKPLSSKMPLVKDKKERDRLVLEDRKRGMSFKDIQLKYCGKAHHGSWAHGICKKYGAVKNAAGEATHSKGGSK